MALSKPSAAPERRVMPALTATDTGVIPMDAVYEVLLRLPAKDLCRFRAVCRPWRSLLSDPHFIAAHAARHPGPLIVAGYDPKDRSHGFLFDIIDLSGRVVKRVRPTPTMDGGSGWWVSSIHEDLVSTRKGVSRIYRLLNPCTGAVYDLPEGLAKEHSAREAEISDHRNMVVFTQVASTGEYKVLRVFYDFSYNKEQMFEIFTLDGSSGSHWRATKACPTTRIDMFNGAAVINGIVYFFTDEGFLNHDAAPKRIVSFDFGTEEWRTTLRGPPLVNYVGNVSLGIATLNGCLVAADVGKSSMDLWFLLDFEKSLWVKQHSIQLDLRGEHHEIIARPISVLNDGRVVTYIGTRGLLRIYNPKTSTYIDVAEMGARVGVGLYTGNLQSLAA